MALQIKDNNQIKGIELRSEENTACIKITQYADDTCMYLKDLAQINLCIGTIKSFSLVSGLKLNPHKTLYWQSSK